MLEKDDFSFRQVGSESDLGWYEQTDIENDEYEGWDSTGGHFALTWDKNRLKPAVAFSGEEYQDPNAFLKAALEYQRRYADHHDSPHLINPDAVVRVAANVCPGAR